MTDCATAGIYDGFNFPIPTDLVCGRLPGHEGSHVDESSDYRVEWPEGSDHWARCTKKTAYKRLSDAQDDEDTAHAAAMRARRRDQE